MLERFECPLCRHEDWEPIEKYFYSIEDGQNQRYTKWDLLKKKVYTVGRAIMVAKPRGHISHHRFLTAYQRVRREVLFQVWFPGEKAILLTSIACRTCGFICYSPRPEEKDIANKYQYLKSFTEDSRGREGYKLLASKLDLKRAERIYGECSKYLARQKLNVLDYGGGDGKIMIPFVKKGHNCYLIDYDDHPIDGVSKIADDINSCEVERKYDLIVCSHVLEHVGDISGLIKALKEMLKPNGIIYAEVPQEIWAGLKIDTDPVTHINFFTLPSLKNLFFSNGFQIIKGKQTISNFGKANLEVVWIIAQADNQGVAKLLPVDTQKLLYPSIFYSVKKISKLLFAMIIRIKEEGLSAEVTEATGSSLE